MKYSFKTRIEPRFDSEKADWLYSNSDYDVHKIGESYAVLIRQDVVFEDATFEEVEKFFENVFEEDKKIIEEE